MTAAIKYTEANSILEDKCENPVIRDEIPKIIKTILKNFANTDPPNAVKSLNLIYQSRQLWAM